MEKIKRSHEITVLEWFVRETKPRCTKSIHVQLHFRLSSVSPGWRRDRARRQQEDRDEGRGRLSKDDARRMARQILRLPELVRIARVT